MKKNMLLATVISYILILSGCSLSEVQIEKIPDENNTIEESMAEVKDFETKSIPTNAKIGDKLFAENLVMNGGSGTIYWTINKVEAFETMQDAKLQLEDMYASEFCITDEYIWDAANETFSDRHTLVMLYMTIENVDAISRAYAEEPEKYDIHDFRVDSLGGCSYGPLRYFDKMGECSVNSRAFHLEPGESIEIKVGYLVNTDEIDLKDVNFTTAATPENGTVIDLNLK